jgi:arylsulfatase A-like enzyme
LQATREDYDALSHITDHTMRVYAAMIRSLDRNIGTRAAVAQGPGRR